LEVIGKELRLSLALYEATYLHDQLPDGRDKKLGGYCDVSVDLRSTTWWPLCQPLLQVLFFEWWKYQTKSYFV